MGRRINKQMTIDMDLVVELDKLELNVSEYCNEKLWDYVRKLKEVEEKHEKPEEIEAKIEKLQEKKIEIENSEEIEKLKKEAGITLEKEKFLKSMGTSIMVAKDMKLAWSNRFGEIISWEELKRLKELWG